LDDTENGGKNGGSGFYILEENTIKIRNISKGKLNPLLNILLRNP
jgi:hypothetical protein